MKYISPSINVFTKNLIEQKALDFDDPRFYVYICLW